MFQVIYWSIWQPFFVPGIEKNKPGKYAEEWEVKNPFDKDFQTVGSFIIYYKAHGWRQEENEYGKAHNAEKDIRILSVFMQSDKKAYQTGK